MLDGGLSEILGVRYLHHPRSAGGDTREGGCDTHQLPRPRLAARSVHFVLPLFQPGETPTKTTIRQGEACRYPYDECSLRVDRATPGAAGW
jgi:hypothetical protein